MSPKNAFAKRFGPGALSGILLWDWIRLLADNRFAIPPTYWIRSSSITGCSFVNSVLYALERLRYSTRVANVEVEPPVFILGHWRQGTTLLHNLLSTDERFHCPSVYQVCNPHIFLTTESSWYARSMGKLLPPKRPMDNMAFDIALPYEDEFAICSSGRNSPYLSWAFPRRRSYYDRYLTMQDVSKHELNKWKRCLIEFLKKLAFKSNRQLVLKSPTHTGRIKTLLELFPSAKFIHIRRNPFDVFQSTQHQLNVALDWFQLQRIDANDVDDWIIKRYREMYDSFFREKELIPEGQFCEVSFENVEEDPIGSVRQVYEAIDLPDFCVAVDKLQEYTTSLQGYEKNQFHDLPYTLRDRIKQEWSTVFRKWGYPTE